MELIKMTDYVYQIFEKYNSDDFTFKTLRYASVLKQNLKLGMFFCFKKEPKAEDFFNVNVEIDKLTDEDKTGLDKFYSATMFYEDEKNFSF